MVTDGRDTYHGDHFAMYKSIESLGCTPGTNRILYVSYASIKRIQSQREFAKQGIQLLHLTAEETQFIAES